MLHLLTTQLILYTRQVKSRRFWSVAVSRCNVASMDSWDETFFQLFWYRFDWNILPFN